MKPSTQTPLAVPEGYADWLAQLKGQIARRGNGRRWPSMPSWYSFMAALGVTFWSGNKARAGAPRSLTGWRWT